MSPGGENASGGGGGGERRGHLKRQREDDPEPESAPDHFRDVRNKIIRSQLAGKTAREKKRAKAQERRKRQKAEQQGAPTAKPKQPRTLESTREPDETELAVGDTEILEADINDEFAAVFGGTQNPKVLLTTGRVAVTKVSYSFISDLLRMLPNAAYWKRTRDAGVKGAIKKALAKEFTDLMVIKEDNKKLTSLTHVHLPNGPTAIYRLTSYKAPEKIPGHGRPTDCQPEVVLNNFTTALGHRVGRMLASVFPRLTPRVARGRQVVTWHNQRDFVFCRFHRYIFGPDGEEARLQELGPRFTLKLLSLQRGLFDKKTPDYEWILKKELETSRRRFFL